MKDSHCVEFLQWALPRLGMRWPGFRKVRRQVCKRIGRRLTELGLDDISNYQRYLEAHPREWEVLDSFCRIPISRFYRDRGVFDFLRDDILPELANTVRQNGQHHVRCWSAGCASGEEPYTLKIIWELSVRRRCPDVELQLVATDIDSHMLDRARLACYSRSSLKDFPVDWLPLAFTQSGAHYSLKPEYRVGISFLQQDMRSEMPVGCFHVIFCRHLAFTYFDESAQRNVLSRIVKKLVPGGVLVTGKQEKPMVWADMLEQIRPNMGIYRKL